MYVDTPKVTLAALIRWMIAIAIALEHVGKSAQKSVCAKLVKVKLK
jgi:hypothetical protein